MASFQTLVKALIKPWPVLFVLTMTQCATAPIAQAVASEAKPAPDWPVATDDVGTAFDAPAPETAHTLEPTARDSFFSALSDARLKLKQRQLSEPLTTSGELLKTATQLDSGAVHQASAFHFEVLKSQKQWAEAAAWAMSWRNACGPDDVERCRYESTRALNATSKAADSATKKFASLAWANEQCLRGAKADSECLNASQKFTEQHADGVTRIRMSLIRAAAEADESKQESGWIRAESICTAKACGELRRKALKKLTALALSKSNIERALGFALKEAEVALESSAESQKTWTRPELFDAVCEKYDEKNGAGACRALERKKLGTYVFTDFSKRQAGEGLSPDEVKRVGQHYAPLLQACLVAQSKSLKAGERERYAVQWTVQNDGRVGEPKLTRKDLAGSPLDQCLREQFAYWRYPKFKGEWQNIEQIYTVETPGGKNKVTLR
jgi:hypothetical protein